MGANFPCVTPVVERFFPDLLRVLIIYFAESHLESCQTSKMKLSREKTEVFNKFTIAAI